MSLTRGFEDLALDHLVAIASAYSTAQKAEYLAAHPGASAAEQSAMVGFTVDRDRLKQSHAEDLALQALVVFGFDGETPSGTSAKQVKHATATFFADIYTAKGETADGLGVVADKGAIARLLYGKVQIESCIFNLANYQVGFITGTIARKPFGRWQSTTGVDETGERWAVSGRWTFDLEYEWAPDSPVGVALDQVSVNAGLWSGLYQY